MIPLPSQKPVWKMVLYLCHFSRSTIDKVFEPKTFSSHLMTRPYTNYCHKIFVCVKCVAEAILVNKHWRLVNIILIRKNPSFVSVDVVPTLRIEGNCLKA